MNKRIEEEFVKNYIVSSKRDRLLFELHGKKRIEGISRFCHCADDFLIESAIKLSGEHITDELQKAIKKSKENKCYIISFYEDIDGTEIDKNEVLEAILGRGMPSIAVFDDFAVLETEQEQGTAMKFLLQR